MDTKRRSRRVGRRSEVLAVRVSPRTRYQAELLALLHQKSVSEIVEAALEQLAALPESSGGATLKGQVEVFRRRARMGDDENTDLVTETWDEEEWARRFKLYLLNADALPPMERSFWLEIYRDQSNFEDDGVPEDIDIEDDDPPTTDELIWGKPNLRLPRMKRDVVRAKWEAFLNHGAR